VFITPAVCWSLRAFEFGVRVSVRNEILSPVGIVFGQEWLASLLVLGQQKDTFGLLADEFEI